MPIYEYQCQGCGHQFETMQKVSEPVLKECPKCGEAQLKKLVSAVAFRLKGGGWYETDFKSGGKKNVAAGETAPATDAKTESKDTKPESKPDTKAADGGSKKSSDSGD